MRTFVPVFLVYLCGSVLAFGLGGRDAAFEHLQKKGRGGNSVQPRPDQRGCVLSSRSGFQHQGCNRGRERKHDGYDQK